LKPNDYPDPAQSHLTRFRKEAGPYFTWLMNVAKTASPIGILVLAIYYFKINVTPDISIVQGAFVAVQAGIIAAILIGLFIIVFSAPAWIYHMLDVRPHLLPFKSRKTAIKVVLRRSLLTQLTAFGAATAYAYWPTQALTSQSFIGPAGALVTLAAGTLLAQSPRTVTSTGMESRSTFWATILCSALSALYSILLVWLLQKSGDASPGQGFRFFATLAALTVLTPMHLAFGPHEVKAHLATASVVLLEVVFILGSPSVPVSMVAGVIGIAERGPVSLVVPDSLCRGFAAAGAFALKGCGQGSATLIGPVRVLNSLGSRWLILDPKTQKTFSIPGKDVIVIRQ
jgi:hypothetical protein